VERVLAAKCIDHCLFDAMASFSPSPPKSRVDSTAASGCASVLFHSIREGCQSAEQASFVDGFGWWVEAMCLEAIQSELLNLFDHPSAGELSIRIPTKKCSRRREEIVL
jgi:hypothetical protein